jgi:hypothetical protein
VRNVSPLKITLARKVQATAQGIVVWMQVGRRHNHECEELDLCECIHKENPS